WGVLHTQLGYFATGLVDDDEIMMPLSPIDASEPHDKILAWLESPGGCVSLYWAVEARPSNHQFIPGTRLGSSFCVCRSSRVEEMRFPWRVQWSKWIDLLLSSRRGSHFNITV